MESCKKLKKREEKSEKGGEEMSGKREESNKNEIGKHKEMKEKGMLIDRQETMRKKR